MKRRLLNLLTALSLLLCAAAVVLWACHYSVVYNPTREPSVYMTDGGSPQWTETHIPPWWWILLSGIAPALWLKRSVLPWLRDRRMRRGLCPACGYDLRATPGRCPECGTPASVTTTG